MEKTKICIGRRTYLQLKTGFFERERNAECTVAPYLFLSPLCLSLCCSSPASLRKHPYRYRAFLSRQMQGLSVAYGQATYIRNAVHGLTPSASFLKGIMSSGARHQHCKRCRPGQCHHPGFSSTVSSLFVMHPDGRSASELKRSPVSLSALRKSSCFLQFQNLPPARGCACISLILMQPCNITSLQFSAGCMRNAEDWKRLHTSLIFSMHLCSRSSLRLLRPSALLFATRPIFFVTKSLATEKQGGSVFYTDDRTCGVSPVVTCIKNHQCAA